MFRLPRTGKDYIEKMVKAQVGNSDIPKLSPMPSVKNTLKGFFAR